MLITIAPEICPNQEIKSVKDECDMTERKIKYEIGDSMECHIDDCSGFFVFDAVDKD